MKDKHDLMVKSVAILGGIVFFSAFILPEKFLIPADSGLYYGSFIILFIMPSLGLLLIVLSLFAKKIKYIILGILFILSFGITWFVVDLINFIMYKLFGGPYLP